MLGFPARRPRSPVALLDAIFHLYWRALALLFTLIVISNLPQFITLFLATGANPLPQLGALWVVQLALTHLSVTIAIAIGLGGWTIFLAIMHGIGHPTPPQTRIRTHAVRHLRVTEWGIDPAAFIPYFPWPEHDTLHRALRRRRRTGGNVVIVGESGIGKTRTGLEAIRQSLKGYQVIAFDANILAADLEYLPRGRLVLWLDDLDYVAATPDAARNLTTLIQRLQAIRHAPIIVATCASHSFHDLVTRVAVIAREATKIELLPLPTEQWPAFQTWLTDHPGANGPWNPATFDGTPGSVMLGLRDRTATLAHLSLPALTLLRVLAILYDLSRLDWTTTRIQHFANFLLPDSDAPTWETAWQDLLDAGWLRSYTPVALRTFAYLTVCLVEWGYAPDRPRFRGDVRQIARALVADDCVVPLILDRYALSDWLMRHGDDADHPLIEALLSSALRCLPSEQRRLIAEGQRRFGTLLSEEAAATGTQEAAIERLAEALTLYQHLGLQTEEATTLTELGNAYRRKGRDVVDLEQSITYYDKAAKIFTQAAFPAEFATIEEHLAETQKTLFEETGERPTLDKAIAATQAAQTVIARTDEPERWATNQMLLGELYLIRATWEVDDLPLAIDAFNGTTEVFSAETSRLRWGQALLNLGRARRELIHRQGQHDYALAEATFHEILTRLHPADDPAERLLWMQAQNDVGWVYLYAAQDVNTEALLRQAGQAYAAGLAVGDAASQQDDVTIQRLQRGLALVALRVGQLAEAQTLFDALTPRVDTSTEFGVAVLSDRFDLEAAWVAHYRQSSEPGRCAEHRQHASLALEQAARVLQPMRQPLQASLLDHKRQVLAQLLC